MGFTDEQIEFMRADIQSDMSLSKMIEFTKKKFKAEGRDFDAEVAALKAKREMEKARAQFRIVKALRKHKEKTEY